MKSKITLLVAILLTTISFAQTKLGTVDTDFIIGKMPQMKNVMNRLDKYAKKLDSSFQIKAKNYG
jgi:outer membrane protein